MADNADVHLIGCIIQLMDYSRCDISERATKLPQVSLRIIRCCGLLCCMRNSIPCYAPVMLSGSCFFRRPGHIVPCYLRRELDKLICRVRAIVQLKSSFRKLYCVAWQINIAHPSTACRRRGDEAHTDWASLSLELPVAHRTQSRR
jgi:hypothetical protein